MRSESVLSRYDKTPNAVVFYGSFGVLVIYGATRFERGELMAAFIKGKYVILSGASSGIGRSLTELLIKKYGCRVLGLARNAEKLAVFKESLKEYSGFFDYKIFDVTLRESWEALRDELSEAGETPDILINNAGILPRFCGFTAHTDEEIRDTMNTNFSACLISARVMLPIIERSASGGIVNISSADALAALAGTSVYSASKSAAKAFTDALREEMRGRLYVGLVCPGFTKTALFSAQKIEGKSNIVYSFATSADRMARKIARGINRRKPRMVYGIDAKLMDFFSRLMPVKSLRLFAFFIKKSKLEIFEDVF